MGKALAMLRKRAEHGGQAFDELKKPEEALPRLKECELEKASRLYKAKDRSKMRWLPPMGFPGFDKRNIRRNRGVLGEGETK